MIPATPLPRLSHLLAAAVNPAPAPRFWQREADQAVWFGKGSWALRALADALAARLGRPPRLLLPEFFCWQALWPLRQGGAEIRYYPVDAMGQMDGLPDQDADLVLALHLFGRPQALDRLRGWCDAQNCLLLEDAAHVLAPQTGVGESGDLVLYSPHKSLAAPDGAVLVIRPSAAFLHDGIQAARTQLGGAPLSPKVWLAKRLIQASPLGGLLSGLRPSGATHFMDDPGDAPLPLWTQPHPLSLSLLARSDLDRIGQIRRANAQTLAAAIAPLAPWHSFGLDDSPVPYRAVFRCDSPAIAQEIFARLSRHRLPVESWPDLPPAIKGGDSMAWRLRQSLICLPCHQSLRPDDLVRSYRHALEQS